MGLLATYLLVYMNWERKTRCLKIERNVRISKTNGGGQKSALGYMRGGFGEIDFFSINRMRLIFPSTDMGLRKSEKGLDGGPFDLLW